MKFRKHVYWNGFIIGGRYICNWYSKKYPVEICSKAPRTTKDDFGGELGEYSDSKCIMVKILKGKDAGKRQWFSPIYINLF